MIFLFLLSINVADFTTIGKNGTLKLIDGYNVIMRNRQSSVSGSDLVNHKILLPSTGMLAFYAAATRLLEVDQNEVAYIGLAAELGASINALDKLCIERLTM